MKKKKMDVPSLPLLVKWIQRQWTNPRAMVSPEGLLFMTRYQDFFGASMNILTPESEWLFRAKELSERTTYPW